MTDPFEQLLHELGVVFHLKLKVDGSGACSILIPPEIVIQLQLDSTQQNLYLFCKIAEIPPGKFRENILFEALKFNAVSDPIPGILCYIHATNHLALYQIYPLSILNGERLAVFFTNFLQVAQTWQYAVANGRVPHSASQQPPFGFKP